MLKIPELIKEARQHVIDKGFSKPDNNIGELLMLIVSELGEALEAHRNNRFANWQVFQSIQNECEFNLKSIPEEKLKFKKEEAFSLCIKDTFEDEIADVFIRLYSLSGLYIPENYYGTLQDLCDRKCCSYPNGIENIGQWLFSMTMQLGEISHMHYKKIIPLGSIAIVLSNLKKGCEILNIDIEKHIAAKMAYNKTRPHKHGKEY